MPSGKMIEEVNTNLKELPKRNMPRNDDDILQKHYFDDRKDDMDQEFKSLLDQFYKIPKERFKVQDITQNIKDF